MFMDTEVYRRMLAESGDIPEIPEAMAYVAFLAGGNGRLLQQAAAGQRHAQAVADHEMVQQSDIPDIAFDEINTIAQAIDIVAVTG